MLFSNSSPRTERNLGSEGEGSGDNKRTLALTLKEE